MGATALVTWYDVQGRRYRRGRRGHVPPTFESGGTEYRLFPPLFETEICVLSVLKQGQGKKKNI